MNVYWHNGNLESIKRIFIISSKLWIKIPTDYIGKTAVTRSYQSFIKIYEANGFFFEEEKIFREKNLFENDSSRQGVKFLSFS